MKAQHEAGTTVSPNGVLRKRVVLVAPLEDARRTV
jgi:hypothetical protein